MENHHPNCHHKTPPKPGEPTCRCFCTCPEMERPQSTPNTQGASWEDLFDEEFVHFPDGEPHWTGGTLMRPAEWKNRTIGEVKSFIREIVSKERAEGERRGREEERAAITKVAFGDGTASQVLLKVWNYLTPEATLPADSTEGVCTCENPKPVDTYLPIKSWRGLVCENCDLPT